MSETMHTYSYEELAKKAYEFHCTNSLTLLGRRIIPWDELEAFEKRAFIDLVTFIKVQP